MAKVHLLSPEPCKDKATKLLADHYITLCSSLMPVELIHYGSSRVGRPTPDAIQQALLSEAERIEKKLQPRDKVFLMVAGKCPHSTEKLLKDFSSWLDTSPGRLVFILGGAYGLHANLLKAERIPISLSPLTFPHELALVIWLEQLYRLSTMRVGKRYHY